MMFRKTNMLSTNNNAAQSGRFAKARVSHSCRAAGAKVFSVVMSALLLVSLSPASKVSLASADSAEQESLSSAVSQLPSGTYWYNGDVSFTTIDSSNTFTSSVWDDYRDNGYDGTGNALGIAGSFHLVAFDTLNTAGSHVYGNMLAKNMTGNQDFGTDSRFDDLYGHSTLTYIQNYQGTHSRFGANSFAKQAVVFGSNTDTFSLFSVNENGHDIINYGNTKTSATKVEFPATIGQDLNSNTAPFIDINDVKTQAVALSNTLASRSSLGGATYDFSDMNNKKITYTKGSGCAYVELSLSDITGNGNPIRINNVPTDGTGALVINVDCQGSSAAMPDQIILNAASGKQAGVGEIDSDTGYVLWNFYNASGATITGTAMVSSILAPGATLNLQGNACGTFIADNITVTGETHTRPFHGKFDKGDTTSVSVEKKWLDSKGEAEVDVAHGAITAELWYADASGNATTAVTDASGNAVTVQLSAENGWKYTWNDLPVKKDGQALRYTVKESGLADADKASYDSSISGSDNSFTITNRHKAEEVEFSLSGYSVRSISEPVPDAEKVCYVDPKVSKALVGRALADGEFSFQLIDDATGQVVSTASNDEYGMVDFDKANNVTGDDMNPCCLRFTAKGTYTYTVREDPNAAKDPTIDYSKQVVTFVTTIDEVKGEDGTTSLKETESKYVCYDSEADRAAGVKGKEIIVTGSDSEHPTITNSVKAIQLGLTKFNADSSAALPGAVYGLYRAGSVSGGEASDAVLVAKATSDANGHMTFATTGASEVISTDTDYWFQEISAPEGYKLSSAQTQKFQIKRVGEGDATKYRLVYADGSASKEYSIGTVIEFGDGSGVTDEALTVKVNKVDSARAGLAGAKLGVRLADSTEAIEEWTSNGAGHVLSGLVAGKQYVLYESEAPNGFAKAADVTFTIDETGAIKLVDGASAKVNDNDVLNAYATTDEASLVNYKQSETVEKKVVQKEVPKTSTTSSTKASSVKTGDSIPILPIAAVVVVCLAVAVTAGVMSRRKGK